MQELFSLESRKQGMDLATACTGWKEILIDGLCTAAQSSPRQEVLAWLWLASRNEASFILSLGSRR